MNRNALTVQLISVAAKDFLLCTPLVCLRPNGSGLRYTYTIPAHSTCPAQPTAPLSPHASPDPVNRRMPRQAQYRHYPWNKSTAPTTQSTRLLLDHPLKRFQPPLYHLTMLCHHTQHPLQSRDRTAQLRLRPLIPSLVLRYLPSQILQLLSAGS